MTWDDLTAGERATLSNTICGDLASAVSLERLGLLEIRRVGTSARGQIAFFTLTEAGESYVDNNFSVPDPSPGVPWP